MSVRVAWWALLRVALPFLIAASVPVTRSTCATGAQYLWSAPDQDLVCVAHFLVAMCPGVATCVGIFGGAENFEAVIFRCIDLVHINFGTMI